MRFRYLAYLGILLSQVSCATLFSGTSNSIHFQSEPSGARIYIDGIEMGRTPAHVTVTKSLSGRYVTLELDGYETRQFKLQQEFDVVSILNVFGLGLGFVIDAATGAVYTYNPNRYNITLHPDDEVQIPGIDQQNLVAIADDDPDHVSYYDPASGMLYIVGK